MSDDPLLKMYETQAELDKLKEEMKEIRNQNNELENKLIVDNLIQTVNDFQTNISTRFETIEGNFNAFSAKVLNHDQILFEMNETLKKMNETLNKQNETTHILKTNVGNQSFISPIGPLETETILLVGGVDGMGMNSLVMLENYGQNWKQLNIKLPYPMKDHGAQFLNNNLYIFGGTNEKNEKLNCTYKLSKSLQWEKMADMNQKRELISNSSVILNNQIWVCGGKDGYSDLESVEMYDPLTNEWKYMKEMNECRRLAAAAVVNGKIFCCGGYTKSVECYDPSSDIWTRICDMPHIVCGYGAVEMDGYFIVIGEDIVWVLDTTDKNVVWIEKPSMSISRRDLSIAKIHEKIFVCGGIGAKGSVELFDGEVWRDGPNMPTWRHSAPAVAIPMAFARSLN